MDFRTAITEATQFLIRLEAQPNAVSAADAERFFESEESTRGFFIAYLTGDWKFFPNTPAVLLEIFRSGNEHIDSVLPRNLVMSAATEALHRRDGNEEAAEGSAQVSSRSRALFAEANSPTLWASLRSMRQSLKGESPAFAAFVQRMNYDSEQTNAALQAIEQTLQADGSKRGH